MLRPYKKTVTELCGGTPPLGGTDSGSEAFVDHRAIGPAP
jgi:hypothetical protein